MTRRWTALLAALPALATVGFGLVATQANAASGAATAVHAVSPLDAAGALKRTYKIVRHLGHGTCQTGSYQVGQAYRCSTPATHSDLLDPCWRLAASTSTMICQAKPWEHKVIELHTTGLASSGPAFRPLSLPWGVRVGAKVRCLRDSGSVFRIDGRSLTYHCSHHRDIFGALHDSGTHWTAHVYCNDAHTRTGYQSIGVQHIAIAWRGVLASSTPSSPSPTATATATLTPTTTPSPTESASPLT